MNRSNETRIRLARSTLLAVAACSASVSAQQNRWVVSTVGAGDATTLQAGVDLAAPGDIVFVESPQAIALGDVVIDGKGIFLESRATWLYFGRITVQNLPAGQTCAIAGFQEVEFVFRNCQGHVHAGALGGFSNTLVAHNCAHVGYNGNALSATDIRASQVLITNSQIMNRFGGPGLSIQDSDVTVIDPIAISGGAFDLAPGAPHFPLPAIAIKNSTLRVIGRNAPINWGATCNSAGCVLGPSILADGEVDLYLSQSVVVNRAIIGVEPKIVPDQAVIVEFGTAATDPGTIVNSPIDIFGEPGDTVFLFASLFVADPLPTPFGDYWLWRTAGAVPFGSGVFDASGFVRVSAPINDSFLPGQVITWQGVTLSPTGEIRLTTPNPVIAIDRRTHP